MYSTDYANFACDNATGMEPQAKFADTIYTRDARGRVTIPGQQLRRPGQELDHCPVRRDRAAGAIRTSAARASWFSCAGVNAAGTGMSCPASSSRAWACRSSPPAGRAVSAS